MSDDYYALIGISPTATVAEIRQALTKEQRTWNARQQAPDINMRQQAERRMLELSAARKTLLNPEARAAYDAERRQRFGEASRPHPTKEPQEPAPQPPPFKPPPVFRPPPPFQSRQFPHPEQPIPTARKLTRLVELGPFIYIGITLLGLAVMGVLGVAELTAIPTRGIADPDHASPDRIPAAVANAATVRPTAPTSEISALLSGPIKAVAIPASASFPNLWIVYKASDEPPPPAFDYLNVAAVAVDGDTGQQLTLNDIGQLAPFHRIAQTGAWFYLGYGVDGQSLGLVELFLVIEFAYIFGSATLRRSRLLGRIAAKRFPGERLVRFIAGLIFIGQFLALALLVYFASFGDPVALTLLIVWPTTLALAFIVSRRFVAPTRLGRV